MSNDVPPIPNIHDPTFVLIYSPFRIELIIHTVTGSPRLEHLLQLLPISLCCFNISPVVSLPTSKKVTDSSDKNERGVVP